MAKVILICGKICSGKTHYAKSLLQKSPAVLLSTDEITLALFWENPGAEHDAAVEKTQKYLFQKSLEILGGGIDIILDWGFWTAQERAETSAFYRAHGIPFEWHYLDTSEETLRQNLRTRNHAVASGQAQFYYFEDTLAERFWGMFEPPGEGEMDVWVTSS